MSAAMNDSQDVIAFFGGQGEDAEGRSLLQILEWGDELMECCHNYVQWLFPTDEPSRFNSDAPLIDESVGLAASRDPVVKENFLKGFARFMKFLGLSIVTQSGELQLAKAANFEKRKLMCWEGPQNHNWMRVSRVLRCLQIMGFEEELLALHDCLEMIVDELPGMVDDDIVQIWRNKAGRMPNLLSQCCTSQVKSYGPIGSKSQELNNGGNSYHAKTIVEELG